jgi:hypothetical protein
VQSISSNTTTIFGVDAASTAGLTITPTSSFNGTVAVSVKQITPISTYGLLLKDSTGAPSMQFSQELASNASIFVGGGAYNLTSGTAGMNTGFGVKALELETSGRSNSAFGYRALQTNQTGQQNVAFGTYALQHNITGTDNSAFGDDALNRNTTGQNNTALGQGALWGNTTGSQNVAVGLDTLVSSSTAYDGTGVGFMALHDSTAFANTAVGAYAGQTIGEGQQNTIVGARSDVSAAANSNCVVVGYHITCTASNQTVIGTASTTQALVYGHAVSHGTAPTTSSSGCAVGSASNDRNGVINLSSGATACVVTFNVAYTAPVVMLTPTTATIAPHLSAVGPISFTVAVAATSGSVYFHVEDVQ